MCAHSGNGTFSQPAPRRVQNYWSSFPRQGQVNTYLLRLFLSFKKQLLHANPIGMNAGTMRKVTPTVFVSESKHRWQIVSRIGVQGEYIERNDAVREAIRLAASLSAAQVLAQNRSGTYDRVWGNLSSF